jgi:hypothetical protein
MQLYTGRMCLNQKSGKKKTRVVLIDSSLI